MKGKDKVTAKPFLNLQAKQVQALAFKEFVDILEDSSGLTLSQHFILILRPCNNNGIPVYEWTDDQLLLVIQAYKKELNEDPV